MSDFFDDLVIGTRIELGSFLFTRDAIITFARAYDPQTFHLDDEAAAQGPFGRLAASGWHTAAVWMKLHVAHRLAERSAMVARGEPVSIPGPSPGFKNLKWIRPVYAGETIAFAAVITAKRATSRPGWGLVSRTGTGQNQEGEPVFSFEGSALWQRRSEDVDA